MIVRTHNAEVSLSTAEYKLLLEVYGRDAVAALADLIAAGAAVQRFQDNVNAFEPEPISDTQPASQEDEKIDTVSVSEQPEQPEHPVGLDEVSFSVSPGHRSRPISIDGQTYQVGQQTAAALKYLAGNGGSCPLVSFYAYCFPHHDFKRSVTGRSLDRLRQKVASLSRMVRRSGAPLRVSVDSDAGLVVLRRARAPCD